MSEDKFLNFCNEWGDYGHEDLGLTPAEIKRKTIIEAVVMVLVIVVPMTLTLFVLL